MRDAGVGLILVSLVALGFAIYGFIIGNVHGATAASLFSGFFVGGIILFSVDKIKTTLGSKNSQNTPEAVASGKSHPDSVKCKKCGYEWIPDRENGTITEKSSKCPSCGNKIS